MMSGGESGSSRRLPPLTVLAQKYSHPRGPDHSIVAYTGKSGLTPVEPPNPRGPFPPSKQKEYLRELEEYQQWRTQGFTTYELEKLEAFAPVYQNWVLDGMPDDGLDLDQWDVPIHPLYQRENWDCLPSGDVGRMPIGNGHTGVWTARNDVVWRVMQPCLKLATLFLTNHYCFPWFDALLCGDFVFIEENIPDTWKGKRLFRFKPRDPVERASDLDNKAVENNFLDFSRRIFLDLSSGWVKRYTSLPSPNETGNGGSFYYGHASPLDFDDSCSVISMAYEMLVPLLRNDLTSGERKQSIFLFAGTLLHETCHAMWGQIYIQHPERDNKTEPYFQAEPLPELGYSMEHSIFGNSYFSLAHILLGREGKDNPPGAIFTESFFIADSIGYCSSKAPAIPPFPDDWLYRDHFPIPIGYFADLHCPDYWINVRHYGSKSTHMWPKTVGSRAPLTGSWGQREEAPKRDAIPTNMELITNGMTTEVQTAVKIENRRRKRAHRIRDSLKLGGDLKIEEQQRKSSIAHVKNSTSSITPYGYSGTRYFPFKDHSNPDLGNDFESVAALEHESDDDSIPPCPRYDEIKKYLLDNKSQGDLCLDTMISQMPEPLFYECIEWVGGLQITYKELNVFLMNCNGQHDMFEHTTNGIGTVKYIRPSPPPSPNPANLKTAPPLERPTEEEIDYFHDLSKNKLPWEYYNQDWHFDFLLNMLQGFDWEEGEPYAPRMDAELLLKLIDWEDQNHEDGLLWCWGPCDIVRRRVENWPEKKIDDPWTGAA